MTKGYQMVPYLVFISLLWLPNLAIHFLAEGDELGKFKWGVGVKGERESMSTERNKRSKRQAFRQ